MLGKITHVSIIVRDQEEALRFYVDKLGFEVRMNMPMPEMGENGRWLTIGLKGQDIEIVLEHYTWGPGGTPKEREATIGKNPGFIFKVDDCHEVYSELVGKGVQFMSEPQVLPWGTQAVFYDLYGNAHLISQDPA